jgi:hypothetical protein
LLFFFSQFGLEQTESIASMSSSPQSTLPQLKPNEIRDENGFSYFILANPREFNIEQVGFSHSYTLARILYEIGINDISKSTPIYIQLSQALNNNYIPDLINKEHMLVPFNNETKAPDNSKTAIIKGKEITEFSDSLGEMQKVAAKYLYPSLKLPRDYVPFFKFSNELYQRHQSHQRSFFKGQFILIGTTNDKGHPNSINSPVLFRYFEQLPGNIITNVAKYLNLADLLRRLALLNQLFNKQVKANNPPVFSDSQEFSSFFLSPVHNRHNYLKECGILGEKNDRHSPSWTQYVHGLYATMGNLDSNYYENEHDKPAATYVNTPYNPIWLSKLPKISILQLQAPANLPSQALGQAHLPHQPQQTQITWENSLQPYSMHFHHLNKLKLRIDSLKLDENWFVCAATQLINLKSLQLIAHAMIGHPHAISILRNFSTEKMKKIAESGQKTMLDSLESLDLTAGLDTNQSLRANFSYFNNLQLFQGEFHTCIGREPNDLKELYGLKNVKQVNLNIRVYSRQYTMAFRDTISNDEGSLKEHEKSLLKLSENWLNLFEHGTNNIRSLEWINYTARDIESIVTNLKHSLETLRLNVGWPAPAQSFINYNLFAPNKLEMLGRLENLKELKLDTRYPEQFILIWPVLASLPHLVTLNLSSSQDRQGDLDQKTLEEVFELKLIESASIEELTTESPKEKDEGKSKGAESKANKEVKSKERIIHIDLAKLQEEAKTAAQNRMTPPPPPPPPSFRVGPPAPAPPLSFGACNAPPPVIKLQGKFRGKFSLAEALQFTNQNSQFFVRNDAQINENDEYDPFNQKNSEKEENRESFRSLRNVTLATKYGLRFPLLFALFHNYPTPLLTACILRDTSSNTVSGYFHRIRFCLEENHYIEAYDSIKRFILHINNCNLFDINLGLATLKRFIEKNNNRKSEFPVGFHCYNHNSERVIVKELPVSGRDLPVERLEAICKRYYPKRGQSFTGHYSGFAAEIYQELMIVLSSQQIRIIEGDIAYLSRTAGTHPGTGDSLAAIKQVLSDFYPSTTISSP